MVEMAPFGRAYVTYYWSSIVSVALSSTIFELFDVKYYRDLEIWVKGHSKSFEMTQFETLGTRFPIRLL